MEGVYSSSVFLVDCLRERGLTQKDMLHAEDAFRRVQSFFNNFIEFSVKTK